MYYEVIFENGTHSLAFYEDDEEALSALNNHQERAKNGETATPTSTTRTDIPTTDQGSWSAERIARVLAYTEHPADYLADQQVPASTIQETVNAMTDENGNVSVPEVAAAVRGAGSPHTVPEGPHDSIYAMEPDHELEWTN